MSVNSKIACLERCITLEHHASVTSSVMSSVNIGWHHRWSEIPAKTLLHATMKQEVPLLALAGFKSLFRLAQPTADL